MTWRVGGNMLCNMCQRIGKSKCESFDEARGTDGVGLGVPSPLVPHDGDPIAKYLVIVCCLVVK